MTDWLVPDWPAPANVVALSTTRAGGVSEGALGSMNLGGHVGDAPEAVAENRRRLRESLGLTEDPAWLRQVHGTEVVRAETVDRGVTEADAAWASGSGIACAVMTADCLPVLLAADDGSVVAAAHAGWRGLAAGVVEATIAALPAPPRDLLAWLGPGIAQAAFEVGDEVRAAFVAADPAAAGAFERNAAGRWQADLYALARRRLEAAGVSRVYGGGLCTYTDSARFFSYRRDANCGRMATLILRREP